MPIYSYRCPECGKIYEKERKMEDRHNVVFCECLLVKGEQQPQALVKCGLIIRGTIRHTWESMAGRGLGVGIEKGGRGYKL